MKKPDWFILIEQWVPRRMGKFGVTLPFLVGALALKSRQTDLSAKQIRDVLDDIIEQPVEGYVTQVLWCPEISAPVLNTMQITSKERMQSQVTFPRPSGEGESLVFGTNLEFHWGPQDPHTWLNKLVQHAEEPITKREFSRIRKDDSAEFKYGDFRPNELDYIRNTIMPT